MTRSCWCGNSNLTRFSEDYLSCAHCGTLISTFEHEGDVSQVNDDAADLYGKDYWFAHMEQDLGLANIYQRARTDLTDRCLHWLKVLLKYRVPPARILELGSAHAGFVALLRWAGFDATGLELSPTIASLARDLFGVPVLQGRVEEQDIAPESVDVIVLMDVLEHLPDPVRTMQHCIKLLQPAGFLLVQTPRYPEGKTLEVLRASGDRFVELLQPPEHLYLFSERAVRQLFADLGLTDLSFEPAVFSHYDMFLTVSRQPLEAVEAGRQVAQLTETPSGRLVLALLDLSDELQRSIPRAVFDGSEADRAARLEVIVRQGRELGEARAAAAASDVAASQWQRRALSAEKKRETLVSALKAMKSRKRDATGD